MQFFLKFLRVIPTANDIPLHLHHVHSAIFSTRLWWWFGGGGGGGGMKLIEINFFDRILFLCVECGRSSIRTCLFYFQHLRMSLWFTWTSCPFSAKTCEEKIATEHVDTAPFVSMWSASSAETSSDICRKKLQRVSPSLLARFLRRTFLPFFSRKEIFLRQWKKKS